MTQDLFSEFSINEFTFKNRLGVAPMTRMSASSNSIPRQDVLDFLVTRAKNGAGLVYTEAIVTDYESAQGYPGQARILNQEQVDAWKKTTDAIRSHGAISICQMFHCGRMAYDGINPANRVIAPSPVAPAQDNPVTRKNARVSMAILMIFSDFFIWASPKARLWFGCRKFSGG